MATGFTNCIPAHPHPHPLFKMEKERKNEEQKNRKSESQRRNILVTNARSFLPTISLKVSGKHLMLCTVKHIDSSVRVCFEVRKR
jgi:hypothetical protein